MIPSVQAETSEYESYASETVDTRLIFANTKYFQGCLKEDLGERRTTKNSASLMTTRD